MLRRLTMYSRKRKTGTEKPTEAKPMVGASMKRCVSTIAKKLSVQKADTPISKAMPANDDFAESACRRSETPTLASSRSRRPSKPSPIPANVDDEGSPEQVAQGRQSSRIERTDTPMAKDIDILHIPSPRAQLNRDENRSARVSMNSVDGLLRPPNIQVCYHNYHLYTLCASASQSRGVCFWVPTRPCLLACFHLRY